MKDIIEQLEEGKKAQENGSIDKDSIYTQVGENETVNKTGEVIPETSTGFNKLFEEVDQAIKESNVKLEEDCPVPQIKSESPISKLVDIASKNSKPLVEPDFDFHDHFEIGQTIYFIRVFENLGTKELLTLKIRTIYNRLMIGIKGKEGCFPMGYDVKDRIFEGKIAAQYAFDAIQVKEVKSTFDDDIKKELAEEGIVDEDSDDYIGNEQETAATEEE